MHLVLQVFGLGLEIADLPCCLPPVLQMATHLLHFGVQFMQPSLYND